MNDDQQMLLSLPDGEDVLTRVKRGEGERKTADGQSED